MTKLTKFFGAALAIAALLLMSSCEEETSSARDYLTGELELLMPAYMAPGEQKSFSIDTLVNKVSREDGGTIGFYFKNPYTGVTDTVVTASGEVLVPVYTVTVSDTLGLTSVVFGAMSSDEYYGKTAQADVTVVSTDMDGTGSITNFTECADELLYTDTREARMKNYGYVLCGNTYWMRRNLAWRGAGRAYEGCDIMDDIYGRFYSWEEAQTACPEGWRLPGDADILELAGLYADGGEPESDIRGLAGPLMADVYFNGTRMWEYWPDVKVSDLSYISLMPTGYATPGSDSDFDFGNVYNYAAFWTSGERDGKGAFRYVYVEKDIVYYGLADKNEFLAPVRCVRTAD